MARCLVIGRSCHLARNGVSICTINYIHLKKHSDNSYYLVSCGKTSFSGDKKWIVSTSVGGTVFAITLISRCFICSLQHTSIGTKAAVALSVAMEVMTNLQHLE